MHIQNKRTNRMKTNPESAWKGFDWKLNKTHDGNFGGVASFSSEAN